MTQESVEGSGNKKKGAEYHAPRKPLGKRLTRKDWVEAGLEKNIMESSDHPSFYVSSWPHVSFGTKTLGERTVYHLPHLDPNSVLITAISNDWHEGAWWRLQNMMRYTEEQGYTVALEEVDDMSTMPADAIGIMRACAAMLALDAGFEWCLMVDNDALVEEDTLVRLIQHDRPVVYPLVLPPENEFMGEGMLCHPYLLEGTGLQPVTWSTMSVMLFNTRVFNCLAPYAWHGHDIHFAQNLAHFGHRIYVDTDTVVHTTRGPARHPAQPWDELWERLRTKYNSRQNDKRHREPPPDFDPAFGKGSVDSEGVYWGVDSWKYGGVNGPMQFIKHDKEKCDTEDAKS